MAVCKSRPEINIKDVIGQYEFSVAPSSLFAPDGTMLHCSAESALKLGGESEQRTTTGPQISANESVNMESLSQMRVAIYVHVILLYNTFSFKCRTECTRFSTWIL